MKPYFPLFVNMSNQKIRVYGAGKIAQRRIDGLLRYGAVITVIAPHIREEIKQMCVRYPGRLSIEKRVYRIQEIQKADADYVLAATDDKDVNAAICLECRQKGIPVNNASDRGGCSFYFPALIERDGLVIGVTSMDGDHKKVARFCERLRKNTDKWEGMDYEKSDSYRDERQ